MGFGRLLDQWSYMVRPTQGGPHLELKAHSSIALFKHRCDLLGNPFLAKKRSEGAYAKSLPWYFATFGGLLSSVLHKRAPLWVSDITSAVCSENI